MQSGVETVTGAVTPILTSAVSVSPSTALQLLLAQQQLEGQQQLQGGQQQHQLPHAQDGAGMPSGISCYPQATGIESVYTLKLCFVELSYRNFKSDRNFISSRSFENLCLKFDETQYVQKSIAVQILFISISSILSFHFI